MRKSSLVLLLLAAVLIAAAFAPGPARAEDVVITRENLTDETGYTYGADFYISNNTSGPLYALVYTTRRVNVVGDVLHGAFLMGPNEKAIHVGRFVSADRTIPWSVYVGAKWAGNAADLADVPE